MSRFSELLKFCREKIGYTFEDMAKNLRISTDDYIKIEQGKLFPSKEIFEELDKHFNFNQFGLYEDIIDDLSLYDLVKAEFLLKNH